MEFITHSPEETEKIGEALAKSLQPGTILAYRGDLGAGKTAFTRGLARGLGCKETVTSPTYTIVNEYLGGRLPLFHFDMYRLGGLSGSGGRVRRGVERERSGRHGGRNHRDHRKAGGNHPADHHRRGTGIC